MFLLVLLAGMLLAYSLHAQESSAPAAALVAPQLTPEAVAAINNLMAFLPASWWPGVALVIGIIVKFGILGRLFIGWRTGGLRGVISGLFGGTNVPKQHTIMAEEAGYGAPTPPKGAELLKLLFVLALPALLLTGCAGPHQYVANESGTGMKLKLPVGYNGNNVFEIDLTVGTFKNTALVQPVSTNRVYTPSLAVAAATRGKVIANAMNSSTNATMNVVGGDSYIVTTGTADGSTTNNTDAVVHTYQDAPAP